MTYNNTEGPKVMWNALKNKKVKSSDGKDLGDVSQVSQYYIRLEKGMVSKDKYWIPKYIADAFDGKSIWLVLTADEVLGKYLYGTEPSTNQFNEDIEKFKSTPVAQKADFDFENVRMVEDKTSASDASRISGDEPVRDQSQYKNIRDVD
jgi:hypothetical protein